MKELYTHAGLALLITVIMFGLSFSEAFIDMRGNALGVILLFLMMSTIGYWFSKIFYEERKDAKDD